MEGRQERDKSTRGMHRGRRKYSAVVIGEESLVRYGPNAGLEATVNLGSSCVPSHSSVPYTIRDAG